MTIQAVIESNVIEFAPTASQRFADLARQAAATGERDYAERLITLAYLAAGTRFDDEAAALGEGDVAAPVLRGTRWTANTTRRQVLIAAM